jgi:hypothetical protein
MELLKLIAEAEGGNIFFSISINPKLWHVITDILKEENYTYREGGDSIDVTPKSPSEKLTAFQDMIYNKLGDMFKDGDRELIDFVGSSEIGDFIDADLGLNIEMYKK